MLTLMILTFPLAVLIWVVLRLTGWQSRPYKDLQPWSEARETPWARAGFLAMAGSLIAALVGALVFAFGHFVWRVVGADSGYEGLYWTIMGLMFVFIVGLFAWGVRNDFPGYTMVVWVVGVVIFATNSLWLPEP